MNLKIGTTYRIVYNAPTTGPYKGFAKKPFTGEYKGRDFTGHKFWDGSSWNTCQASDIKSATEVK